MSTLTNLKSMGDLLKLEFNAMFNRKTGVRINNDTGGAVTVADPLGLPLKESGGVYTIALDSEETSIDALVLSGPAISALANGGNTDYDYVILERGPAVVNKDQINIVDVSGGYDLDLAAIVTRLLALNIVCIEEPDTSNTQST